MPPVRVVATTDAPQIAVSSLLKDPLTIPQLILTDVNQMFIADKLLRQAGTPAGGTVRFYESSPLFADSNPEFVEEFGEIPVGTASLGPARGARTRKRALGLRVSQEMADRNQIDLVNQQIRQVRATMVRDWDQIFINAITSAPVNTMAATAAFGSTTAKIRRDVLSAVKQVTDARRGFIPDTLVVTPSTRIDLMTSAEITQIFVGDAANQNPLISGTLDFQFAGLDVMQTYNLPAGVALVLQRNVIGGIADERALQATPLYRHNETETWRTDVLRTSAVFVDQPLACSIITGV